MYASFFNRILDWIDSKKFTLLTALTILWLAALPFPIAYSNEKNVLWVIWAFTPIFLFCAAFLLFFVVLGLIELGKQLRREWKRSPAPHWHHGD